MESAISYEHLLARLLGMEGHPSLTFAALRRFGEESGSEHAQGKTKAHWLCADPVNLSFIGDHVLLDEFGGDEGEIDAAEVAALIATLNEDFADLGHFSAATPTRWYLRMERPAKALFFPLGDVVCRPVRDFLPTGGEGEEGDDRHWRHMLNEIQVMLHNHPVNIAREANGRRLINSLWFWGNGAQSKFAPSGTPRFAVQAFDPMARGLARAAGIEPDAPDVNQALRANTLVVLDTLALPVRRLDLARWQDALAALERDWFAPIARALGRGVFRHFALHVPGERAGFSLTLGIGAHWRFWRKPLLLSGLPST